MDCAVVYSEAALSDLHDITAFIAEQNALTAAAFGVGGRWSVVGGRWSVVGER
jgi:arginine/lysine/ornithine decarboxylase